MAICKHCGTELPKGMEVCPNCGQRNSDYVDESYLDQLLSAVVSDDAKKDENRIPLTDRKKKQPEEPVIEAEDPELEEYNIFDDFDDFDEAEIDQMISRELAEETEAENKSTTVEHTGIPPESGELQQSEELPLSEEAPLPEGLSLSEESSLPEEFFPPAEPPQTKMTAEEEPEPSVWETDPALPSEESSAALMPEDDLLSMFSTDLEEPESAPNPEPSAEPEAQDDLLGMLNNDDIVALDDLFRNFSEDTAEGTSEAAAEEVSPEELDGLLPEQLTSASESDGKKKPSFWMRVFGNVPVDPSKRKPEPTPEELEAAKAAKAEEKKKTSAEKRAAAAEKRQAAKAAKAEKARQAQLAKEEKKARKLEQAKQILEELEDTRINRLGASIVFILFGLIAIVLIVGSNLFTYAISVSGAEKSFHMALNNDVRYYTDAYNQIFGLDLKEEDQELGDKIMTVMFVNKQLNSYNNYVAMKDYAAALDSLFKGLLRYDKYLELAYELDIQDDLNYVRSQICREMENHYAISEEQINRIISDYLQESKDGDAYLAKLEYSKVLYELAKQYQEE